jgi:hypothetical protein
LWVLRSRFDLGVRHAWSFRCFYRPACPRTRLLGHLSHGVRPSFMVRVRCLRPRPLGREPLSWGSGPFDVRGLESPRPRSVAALWLPQGLTRGFCRCVPGIDYGAARRLSQPLSGVFLSPPSRHFQAGDVRGVLPSGVSSSLAAPVGSSPPGFPHDVPPAW